MTHALKEWQVAVDALEKGETILLLRKGGIREAGGKFAVVYDHALLYPTYEHQKPNLLKAPYANQVKPVEPGWHPEQIRISVWAEVTEAFQISDADRVSALMPFHIWSEAFVRDRLQWKPNQPLSVLLLRVYQLTAPQTLPYLETYGGCKSWIDLADAIALNGTPVLSDPIYTQQVNQIRSAIA